MAERRIQQRQGRRDNFRGVDNNKVQQEIEIKRRSRSEGPTRRIKRDDKRVHQTDSFAKGDNVSRPAWAVEETSTATRVSRHSPPISDDNGFNHFMREAGSDSDSYDSDEKKWTKNPLVTRKARRSGAYGERRRSNIDNGSHISTRDSFVYYSTSGQQDKSDSSTGSFKGNNKYQKLEELRKKRIDIQMTSDEENTPESRISRLRQRAIQGGLGGQLTRNESQQPNVPSTIPTNTPRNFQQNTRNSAVYNTNSQNNSASQINQSGANQFSKNTSANQFNQNLPRNSQGNYAPPPTSSYQPAIHYQQSHANSQKQTPQQNCDPVPFGSPQTARVTTYGKLITNNDPSMKPYTGVLSDSGPTSKNIQNPNYSVNKNTRTTSMDNPKYSPVKTGRFVYNSSPEIGRKFDLSAARGSSIDSVYDTGVAQPDPSSTRANILQRHNQHGHINSGFQTGITKNGHKAVYVNPPVSQTMEVQRGSVIKYPVSSSQCQPNRSPQVNQTVDLRFETNKKNRGSFSPIERDFRNLNRAHSEDSLDEIVMSNVQYLEAHPGKGKIMKGDVPVSRSASLPDPKRFGMTQTHTRSSGEIGVPFSSGHFQRPVVQTVPYRQKVEKSELEIRVALAGNSRLPPEIKIAPENRMDPMDYNGYMMNLPAGFAAPRQERKLSYDSHTGNSRPTSQYYDREEISKSDTQLNTATIMPHSYKGELLHPMCNYNPPKSVSAEQLLPPGTMAVVHSRPIELGMVSDVDYEVEVSDRIKKWENYMKKSNEVFANGSGLTTIQERTEQDFGLTPHDIRRAPPTDVHRPIAMSSNYAWSNADAKKSSSSDPTVHLVGDPQIISHETNTHRLFQLIPGGRIQTTSNSMSTLYHAQPPTKGQHEVDQRSLPTLHYPSSVSQKPISAGQLREKIIIDRQSSLDDSSLDSPINSDKGSKYMRYQELHDINESKDESVRDLCRLFNFNEDSEGRKIAKVSPHKANDDEWAKIISDMEDNIKKADVWSPHMESTKGESLSIERVKARTLQTIPFSDDPFWKEIEEMTSFESLVGQKSGDSSRVSSTFDDQYIGRIHGEGSQSQGSTLPSQPRLTTSSRDRLQRSKSLYTPNIAPLTLGMPPRSHNSQSTLEDALEELKCSVDRSSTRDSFDSKSSSQTQSLSDLKISAPVRSSMYIENITTRDQPKKTWNQHRGSGVYDIPENVSVKELYTFSTEPGQAFPNVVNGNYELDPNLLKNKLLNTGLVEDTTDPFYQEGRVSHGNQSNIYHETVNVTSKPVAMAAPQRFYQSEDKVNQVSQSMEDLRQLAKNVENKIELIKYKLVQADDTNLDKILLALRKFAPSAGPKSPEIRSDTMHDFYNHKHSKLTDALTELERIYKNLDLDNEMLFDRAERRDYPSYRKPSPELINVPPLKRETTSLSINIAPPACYDRADVELQTQSEFDAISKSFQAILDEVNQTSAVTTSSEDIWISGPQSTPDSPRLPMRVTLKSTQLPTPTSKSPNASVSTVSDSDQSRVRKSRQRFRSKIPDIVGDDVAVRKARSKSSPRIETTAAVSPSPTSADYLNPREITAAKGRIRIRPEREPDVMYDDMAYRNLTPKEPQDNLNTKTKSSIQIELSSPESPHILPEQVFELKFSGGVQTKCQLNQSTDKASAVPAEIQSKSELIYEPKIMGGISATSNSPRQIKSLQLGKSSSLPTKVKPKELVTATKKEVTITTKDSNKIDPVPTTAVALAKIPSQPNTVACTMKISQSIVQQTPTIPKQFDKEKQDAINVTKVEAKTESTVKPSITQVETPPSSSITTSVAPTIPVNISEPPATKSQTTVVSKTIITKKQTPKLATAKLAKFNQNEKTKGEIKSCKDTKLKMVTKIPNPKIVPPQKTVKTELKLSTGNKPVANGNKTVAASDKTVNNKTKSVDTSCKLSEKEIVIKLPTASTKQKPENLPIPEKRTVETQTISSNDKKSKSKQSLADRRLRGKKYGRGVAGMVDLFSSSDEERNRKSRPLLTRSAPDLSLLSLEDDDDVDADLVDDDPTSKGTQAEDNTDFDESDAVFSEDLPKSPPQSPIGLTNDCKPLTCPPALPVGSPDCARLPPSGKSDMSGDNITDNVHVNSACSDLDKSVILRRRHSLERTIIDNSDQLERPKSFHELLASFETNKKRLNKLKSLRKCLSEDNMVTETFVAKVYLSGSCLSEPDLSDKSIKMPTKEGRRTYPGRDGDLLGFSSSVDRYGTYGQDYTSGLRNSGLHFNTYSRDYVTDSMSRYSSRTYDSGLSSRRYDSTPSRAYTSGSSYTSGTYSSTPRSFDSSRYGSSSSRYGGSSSYTSDLTSSTSRYGSSGVGSRNDTPSYTYSSSRTSIPKSDDISSRRGSRSSLSSDVSVDTKDTDLGDISSSRRRSLRSNKTDKLTSRRPSYKDDASGIDSSSFRNSTYSRRTDMDKTADNDNEKYRSSRKVSLRDSSSVESIKDPDIQRSDYRRYSNSSDIVKSSVNKQFSLEKLSTVDKSEEYRSPYSYKRALHNQTEENSNVIEDKTSVNDTQNPAIQRKSYQSRRELERNGTESNDSDVSTRKSNKNLEEDSNVYESFAERQRKRRESFESNNSNTETEASFDKTRWRSFASKKIKEVSASEKNGQTETIESKTVFCMPVKQTTASDTLSINKKTSLANQDDSMEIESRAERIAQYKEQRRRQLQNMGTKFDTETEERMETSKINNFDDDSQKTKTNKIETSTISVEDKSTSLKDSSKSDSKPTGEAYTSNLSAEPPASQKEKDMKEEITATKVLLETPKLKTSTETLKISDVKAERNTTVAHEKSTDSQKTATVKKERSPQPKSTPVAIKKEKSPPSKVAQDKQKITEDTNTRSRTRLTSTAVIKKNETSAQNGSNISKNDRSPIVKVSTAKSAANVTVKIENKKPIRVVQPVKKTDDGFKVARKTVSERFAKTQIPGRKPSSGNYTSDDEESKQERPRPPKSPASRRSKPDASKSPSSRRRLPDITRLSSSSKTKSLKSPSKESEVKDSKLKHTSPSTSNNSQRLQVPESPANLDKLLQDNHDYLSEESTIKTPSPVKKVDGSRGSFTDDIVESPVQNVFKNGLSQPTAEDNLLKLKSDLKGDNSTTTCDNGSKDKTSQIKEKGDSDEEEFNTAPSTPQIPRHTTTQASGQTTNGRSHDKNLGVAESSKDRENKTPALKSTTVRLVPTFHPTPVVSMSGPVKPSHTILTDVKLESKSKAKADEVVTNNQPIKRGNNFNQLLQKFSSSELSSSERSESEPGGRLSYSRPHIHSGSISSSDESNTERRTPERSHSFKLRTVKEKDETPNLPKRSSSFKSEFMRKRYQTDRPPSEELVSVLKTRSDITDNNNETEIKKFENLDNGKTIASPVEEIIVDKELSAVLRLRRKETDTRVEPPEFGSNTSYVSPLEPIIVDKELSAVLNSRRKETDANDSFISDNISQSKSRLYKIDSSLAELTKVTEELDKPESTISKGYMSSETELGPISQQQRKSSSASLSDAVQYIKDVETSISTRISETLSKHQDAKQSHETNTSVSNTSLPSIISKMPTPRGIQIIGDSSEKSNLFQTLEIKNVTMDETSTDDMINISESSSLPHVSESIRTTEHLISSRENGAKLHDINKSKTSASTVDNNETDIRKHHYVLDQKFVIADSVHQDVLSASRLDSSTTNYNKQSEVVMSVDDMYTQSGDGAKYSIATTCIPTDSDSLVISESKYSLQRDSLSIPSGRHLDVSESSLLTSSDRSGRELSETSTDENNVSHKRRIGLNRSESLKTPSVRRTESLEKRKGILKRTPSLPKQPSRPIIDEELAKILQQRKQAVEINEPEEQPAHRRLSVSDDILETMKREKDINKVTSSEEDEETKLSVSERIFKMQTKIEEEKYAPTPRSRSGIATPKSPFRVLSGAVTPKKQMSLEEFSNDKDETLSSEKLIERLTTLAEDGNVESILERRKKLEESQNKHENIMKQKRDRRRTQPVTTEEITAADSLNSVNTFRALVRKKASTTVFEQLEQKPKLPICKKSEFPEHLQPTKKRRSRGERYQTLPVTAAELMCIPEHEMMESDSLRSKVMARGRQDSKADSGILSGSDNENLSATSDSLRSLCLDMDLGDDDVSRLSVSAKASMFKQIEEKTSKDRYKGSASGAKRYIDRKKRERYLTQPITEEEVKSAAEFNDEQNTVNIPKPEVVNRTKSFESENSVDEEDELTKLSLKDKLKLFAEKKEEEEKPPPKQNAPILKRRSRKQMSRFSTQPVTIEEVEKAAKISPLLMSLVKPPDPEILKGLSLKAQRDLAASHAEACLSQSNSRNNSRPNSRPGSQPSSRRASFSEDDVSSAVKVSHAKSEGDLQKSPGILRNKEIRQSSPDLEVRSILKSEREKKDQEPRGILKQAETIETHKSLEETKSILKNRDSSLSPNLDHRRESRESKSEPRSILRTEDIESLDYSGISLERKDSLTDKSEPRGILKKESSFEAKKCEPERGVLKKLDDKIDDSPVKSILKKDDEANVDSNNVSTSTPESTHKRRSRQSDRYLTQPTEVTPEKSPQSKRKYKYDGRQKTQPITPAEMKEANLTTPEIMKGGSVADRLHLLKKSGEEEWKKRVPKSLDFDSPQEIKLREMKGLSEGRPVSLADRLNLLDVNKTTWKERVEEKDASNFTVAGKISKTVGTVESPLVKRLKKKDGLILDFGSNENSPVPSPVTTPTRERIPLPRDIITHTSLSSSTTINKVKNVSKTDQIKIIESVTVEIPQFSSSELDSFFLPFDENAERISVDIDDFNDIFINSNDILTSVKKIRPSRKRPTKGGNPMKNISVEVKTEYTEVTTGLAEKELKRVSTERIAKDVGFAQEALAGLASKENFSKVALRKTDVTSTPGCKDRIDPFKDIMLLHVKGRRNVQTHLVAPTSLSINSGDCYVLITQKMIINWVGNFSNVIEKAKSADITSFIHQKRDMGCKSGTSMATVEEEKQRLGAGKHFWATLGGQEEYQAVGPEEEDEMYENLINKTNMVYKLEDNSLLPYEEYWGATLKYNMLDPEMTLVFDFGSELYLWLGKKVSPEDRKIGRILCEQLWDKGYDYSFCDINPLSPLHTEDTGSVPLKSNTRPDWALFGKVHQGMETILFKEKFIDWPDSARIIKVKGQDTEKVEKIEVTELQAYDVSKMVPLNTSPVTLVLEGANVGRGSKWLEDMQGFLRQIDIITLGVNVWHVMEYDHFKLDKNSFGQFHDGDTYVVRWQYMISNAGLKSLKGQAARHSATGRERCAYFFWQGKESTINEKGASALMTVELDEERGPQVRVIQGKEPPCFLNLFHGSMIIHVGKREDEASNTQGPWRLYSVRNQQENEVCLVEIPLCIDNLRSRSSFILLNVKTGHLYIWHGAKSPHYTRKLSLLAAEKLKTNCPLEVGLHHEAGILITEMEEGEEKAQIWGALESRNRSKYMSLLESSRSLEHSTRLFHMTSVSGVFEVIELLNPTRCEDLYTPFPFLQSDLYKVSQPALFLVDNQREVYLWQGWWPEGSEDDGNVHTGSAHARFNIDRKCALETTINYCKGIRTRMPAMYTVCAGLEPQQFTNIFPYWVLDEKANELNMKTGKKEGYMELAEELLCKLTKTRYTYLELQDRPLPEGVDASKLEAYLDDEEFEHLLQMNKEEFYALPSWKQIQLKQPAGLF